MESSQNTGPIIQLPSSRISGGVVTIKRYNNSLDPYRTEMACSGNRAAQIRTALLGDPRNPEDQNRESEYMVHVEGKLRLPPHMFRETAGDPPVHTMLADYVGHFGGQPLKLAPPRNKVCVIVTQRNQGTVFITLWSKQKWCFPSEGMVFNLLDDGDGNVPAIFTCGMLRVDPSCIFPNASEEVHACWQEAEDAFFRRALGVRVNIPGMRWLYQEKCLQAQQRWWVTLDPVMRDRYYNRRFDESLIRGANGAVGATNAALSISNAAAGPTTHGQIAQAQAPTSKAPPRAEQP